MDLVQTICPEDYERLFRATDRSFHMLLMGNFHYSSICQHNNMPGHQQFTKFLTTLRTFTYFKTLYWVWLGWSYLFSQDPIWCCVWDLLLNTLMFGLLLNSVYTASRLSCFSCSAFPMNRLEVGNTCGRNTAETPDPSWLKGYSISYNIMLRKKSREAFPSKVAVAWRLPGLLVGGGK